MTKPFPWDEAMQFGFGVLHLSPDAFWKMTPRELAQAIIAVRGRLASPLARRDLDALMQAFPDTGQPISGAMCGPDPRIHRTLQD
ncbi:rcc01693 family protein [uncultured Bradyrhizobium sp.]|uniref:rcc01693 family protein n=1 Tax=uncultured Bradyrhizobium sp. TaxID=199684 RepID=UPI0035C96BE1